MSDSNGIAYRVGTIGINSVSWQPNRCHNPHLVLGGSSGAGKTYAIREIVNSFSMSGVLFTVIDKHGDIDGLSGINTCEFGYGFKKGINPLRLIPDPKYGGPEANAISFIGLLNDLSGIHRLGPEQQNMLHNTIVELYRANRIIQEDVGSWEKKTYPDLGDLQRFLMHKYRKLLIGGGSDNKDMEYLNSLFRDKKSLERLEKAAARGEEVSNKIEEKIAELVEKYTEYLRKGILNDKDFLVYTNPKGLLAVKNRIQNINNSGVFVKDEVSLANTRIVIRNLGDEQKKMITFYVLKRFLDLYLRSRYSDCIRHYLVIDECSFFLSVPKIAQLIIRIVQEGRKFGLGVILATQNILDFSRDILLNTATKIIFAVEPVIQKDVSRAFGVEESFLKRIRPRESCLFSTRTINNGAYYTVKRTC